MSAVEQLYTHSFIETVLDLPLPPSVNRAWRSGNGRTYLAPSYLQWRQQAGLELVYRGALRGRKTIRGPFTALIEIRRDWPGITRNRFDLDNRTKPLFDFCQEHGFIENDRDLEEYTVRWSADASAGCRVTLRSVAA